MFVCFRVCLPDLRCTIQQPAARHRDGAVFECDRQRVVKSDQCRHLTVLLTALLYLNHKHENIKEVLGGYSVRSMNFKCIQATLMVGADGDNAVGQ